MKVCTDSCVAGAWFADVIIRQKIAAANCLDIGTGTGLLALLLAQKINSFIDGIEIDESAWLQSAENFAASPWKDRLTSFYGDIKSFATLKKYDLIISNPPFFENDLRSGNKNRNISMHDETLNLQQLISAADSLLTDNGYFGILLPFKRLNYFEAIATETKMYSVEKLLIRQTPQHDFFRCVLICSRLKKDVAEHELTIKDGTGKYSSGFIDLLKDYYLAI